MKIKEGFVLTEVKDQYLVVPVGRATKDFRGVIKLNSSAVFLWNLLKVEQTKETMIDKLKETYNIPYETAKKDVDAFVKTLKEAGILSEM